MRILVTGAAGFIGSHLCERLKADGHDVLGVDSFAPYYSRALKELNADALRQAGIEVARRDLASDRVEDLLDGVEVIYHAAAQPGISAGVPFDDYLRNNIVATQRLVEAAMRRPELKCFIYLSTSSVYGRLATCPEEAEPKPTSHYGVTKLAAEQIVLALAREKGLPACSLRLYSVYGPRERPEKLYPRLIHSILSDREFPLYEGSLEHSRSFTYVDDITRGCAAVLDHLEACRGEIINLGSRTEITTRRGIEIVEGILGKRARFKALPPRPGDQLRTQADTAKAERLLEYAPGTRAEEGLRREVAWYKDAVFGKVDPYAAPAVSA
jgi:nucleoside-diphosphate-sugar epimerase